LEELEKLVHRLAETLPPCPAGQLQALENSIAEAGSLALSTKIFAELEAFGVTTQDIQPTIDRGILRWEQNVRLRKAEEEKRLVATQALNKALSTLKDDVKRALANVSHEQDQDAITSGAIIEALLQIDGFNAAVSIDSPILDSYLVEAAQRINPPNVSLIKEAAGYFAKPNGVLIYMRHPASPPKSFFGLGQDIELRPTGVLIRQLSPDTFQAEHASRDRVDYGRQVDGRERFRVEPLPSAANAMAYIKSLGSKHWYTNFIHPNSPLSQVARFPYPEEKHRVFISWKDRAQHNYNS